MFCASEFKLHRISLCSDEELQLELTYRDARRGVTEVPDYLAYSIQFALYSPTVKGDRGMVYPSLVTQGHCSEFVLLMSHHVFRPFHLGMGMRYTRQRSCVRAPHEEPVVSSLTYWG